MSGDFRAKTDGLSMRQTIALGLLAGLGATVVHGIACNANPTPAYALSSATLPLHSVDPPIEPTQGRMLFALLIRPAPRSPGADSGAVSGPASPRAPASLSKPGAGMLRHL